MHSEEQLRKLASSIQEYGWTNPVLIDAQRRIVAGAGRVEAAKRLGIESVPCLRLEGLSEQQIRAYVIADNRLAEDADWDRGLLASELRELRDADIDLAATGFYERELATLLFDPSAEAPPPVTALGKAKELACSWATAAGQRWSVGRHVLLIGDSALIDRAIVGSVDGICTDPPFDLAATTIAAILRRYATVAILMGADSQIIALAHLWRYRLGFVWHRRQTRIFGPSQPVLSHTLIAVYSRSDRDATEWRRPRSDFKSVIEVEHDYEDHRMGHAKCVEVFIRMLEGFRWAVVLDPFAGTGPTLLAAEQLGRRAVLIERDPQTAVALQRFADARLKPTLEP